MLQICHKWALQFYIEFEYGNKLEFSYVYEYAKSKKGKKKKKVWKFFILSVVDANKQA